MIDTDLAHRIRQAVTLADRRAAAALLRQAQLSESSHPVLVDAVNAASSFLSGYEPPRDRRTVAYHSREWEQSDDQWITATVDNGVATMVRKSPPRRWL